MIRNYLTTAIRNLRNNKGFSAINIIGLALGLTGSLLIFLWVRDEIKMDGYHANGQNLYRIMERPINNGIRSAQYYTPGNITLEMPEKFPEVVRAAGISWQESLPFEVNGKINKETGSWAGADWFNMFSVPLLVGSPETALKTPNSLVISRKLAENYFGSAEKAVGKSIRIDNSQNYLVTAVFEDLPVNASEKYDFLLSWEDFLNRNPWAKDWNRQGPQAYVQLRPDTDAAAFEVKIKHFLRQYNKDIDPANLSRFDIELFLQPYEEIYLHSKTENGEIVGGRIEYVRLFTLVAVFLLVIACINFMNLSTARSGKRAKEVAIRKVVGAERHWLIVQFIGEALVLTLIALLVSLVLIALLLPAFNQLTGKTISLPFLELDFVAALVVVVLVTGVLAGSYPALFLSSLQPVRVLKGSLKFGRGAKLFRQGLVVAQFVISLLLIIGTFVVYRQVNYLQTTHLGFDRENLIYVPIEGELAARYGTLKQELVRMPGIHSVTRIEQQPTFITGSTNEVAWMGKNPNVNAEFTNTTAGYDLTAVLKVKMVNGRDFSRDFATDSAAYLINEQAARIIGYPNPVDQPLTFRGKPGKIIGVMQNFHFRSLHEPIQPLILSFGENEAWGNLLVRTQPGKTRQALNSLEAVCKRINPKFPFSYAFADAEYQQMYQSEQIVSSLTNYFAVLAVFIACLGLSGLASFTAEQRTREIGVRKVLGASVAGIVSLLSRDFIKLVVIAILIATPLAWWVMYNWLQNFEYRIEIKWWMFVAAGLLAVVIAVLTVSFQAVKAALANPLKSIKAD